MSWHSGLHSEYFNRIEEVTTAVLYKALEHKLQQLTENVPQLREVDITLPLIPKKKDSKAEATSVTYKGRNDF
jgi:hypothetical protein